MVLSVFIEKENSQFGKRCVIFGSAFSFTIHVMVGVPVRNKNLKRDFLNRQKEKSDKFIAFNFSKCENRLQAFNSMISACKYNTN